MTTPTSSTPAPAPQPQPPAVPAEPSPAVDIRPDPMLSQVIERADPNRPPVRQVLTRVERATEGGAAHG
jgi:hypothetical protein